MTSHEYAALQHLVHHRGRGLTPSQLGRRLAITSGSVTKLIDRLEERGMVRRQPRDGSDRRSRLTVVATRDGTKLIDHDLRTLTRELPAPGRQITPAEAKAVTRLLAAVDQPPTVDTAPPESAP
jgi:DNA-binding MarR family transcriptional regulator